MACKARVSWLTLPVALSSASSVSADIQSFRVAVRPQLSSPVRMTACGVERENDTIKVSAAFDGGGKILRATIAFLFFRNNAPEDSQRFLSDFTVAMKPTPREKWAYSWTPDKVQLTQIARYGLYVRCDIAEVELGDGARWNQPPARGPATWTGLNGN